MIIVQPSITFAGSKEDLLQSGSWKKSFLLAADSNSAIWIRRSTMILFYARFSFYSSQQPQSTSFLSQCISPSTFLYLARSNLVLPFHCKSPVLSSELRPGRSLWITAHLSPALTLAISAQCSFTILDSGPIPSACAVLLWHHLVGINRSGVKKG